MTRKLILALCALALTLSSCGRQVTPDRPGTGAQGLKPGQMQIKFTTQGNLDFVNNWYVLAFDLNCTDSTGQTCEPYAYNGNAAHNYFDWDFEMVLYQPNTSSAVQTSLWEFVQQTVGTTKVPVAVPFVPGVDIFINPNCNNNSTQYCVTVNRRIFNGVATVPNPTPAPLNGPGGTWYINWLVASPQRGPNGEPAGAPIWAPGPNGINDTSQFKFPLASPGINVNTSFDQIWNADASWPQAGPQSAQGISGEVINSP